MRWKNKKTGEVVHSVFAFSNDEDWEPLPTTAREVIAMEDERAISGELMNLYKILWVPGYVNDLPRFLLVSVPALRRLLPEPLQGPVGKEVNT